MMFYRAPSNEPISIVSENRPRALILVGKWEKALVAGEWIQQRVRDLTDIELPIDTKRQKPQWAAMNVVKTGWGLGTGSSEEPGFCHDYAVVYAGVGELETGGRVVSVYGTDIGPFNGTMRAAQLFVTQLYFDYLDNLLCPQCDVMEHAHPAREAAKVTA